MRLKNPSEIPKPLVKIGHMPILLHIMKYYSHFGINDFILCLGYKGDAIRDFFSSLFDNLSHDFLTKGGRKNTSLFNIDFSDWKISFIETGLHANIGQRLKAAEEYLADEEVFMANYADVLTDLPLLDFLDNFQEQGRIASFLGVRPYHSFHVVTIDNCGYVSSIQPAKRTDIWINGGYFIFRKEIYQYIKDNEELVEQPFQRLIAENQLISYKYHGFWGCMDTFKDKQQLEDLYNSGKAPWEIWQTFREYNQLRSKSS